MPIGTSLQRQDEGPVLPLLLHACQAGLICKSKSAAGLESMQAIEHEHEGRSCRKSAGSSALLRRRQAEASLRPAATVSSVLSRIARVSFATVLLASKPHTIAVKPAIRPILDGNAQRLARRPPALPVSIGQSRCQSGHETSTSRHHHALPAVSKLEKPSI